MKKIFIEWLKSKGVFEMYYDNWKKYTLTRPIVDPKNYIFSTFAWRSTPEGFKFWYEVDTQWYRFLKDNNHV